MAAFILPTLTSERLREVLRYDPETGLFTWLKPSGRRAKAGAIAGSSGNRNYIRIRIDRVCHYAHRLAWFYVHESWGLGEIDHINGDASDNRIANLRDASRSVNQQNLKSAKAHNKTGLLGVRAEYRRRTQSIVYLAHIVSDGRQRILGRFLTAEEAYAAYVGAKRRLHEGSTL